MIQKFATEKTNDGVNVTIGKNTIFFPNVTPDYLEKSLSKYNRGEFLHLAFSELDEIQRRFLLTGWTKEEWNRKVNPDSTHPYGYFE